LAFPIQQSVIDFHNKFGHPVRDTPQTITAEEAGLAFDFIEEEVMELWDKGLYPTEACEVGEECVRDITDHYAPNIVEIADALGDIVFTAYGKAIRHGIDLDRVLAAICESNMTKTPNGMGKIKKGDDYVPPRIAEALGL
jgi:predicted HAD superfamily Cof-like phosphohydrolase